MTTGTLTLYGETLWISPYVFSAFVALKEKGVGFEVSEVSLMDGQHRQPPYRDASLTARVPSLEHDGFWLSESSAIAEYLDELLPAPEYPRLLPERIQDRARARQVMALLRSDFGRLREERATVTMFFRCNVEPLGPAAARDAEKLLRVADALIRTDAETLFSQWSIADADLTFMLHRLLLNGDAVPERIGRYAKRQWQRASTRAWVEHARPATVPEAYWSYSGLTALKPR
jgi:glutathione S-transferase